ncbi:unnamed protein product [Arabidopsis halleri]
MWNQKPCFRFEIDNFSEKKYAITSQTFVSGGCEWYLHLYPKGDSHCDDHITLYLNVANRTSLESGWKRSAKFYFSVLNESEKELYRSPIREAPYLFCVHSPGWGFPKVLPLSKFEEKGFLEKDRLIIEVYIKVVEAVDGEGGGVSNKKETVDIIGSEDYASQASLKGSVTLVRKIFAEHPEIAEEFKPKNQVFKKEYMNILRNAYSKVSELAEVKMDWVKSKIGEVSLERKKGYHETSEVPLDNKIADDDDDESWAQDLEERIKNLERMEFDFKMDCLKSKLDEISLERKISYDADRSRFQQLEKRVKVLELMENGLRLDSLKSKLEESKLEEVSLEKKKTADADGSQVQELEDRVKNLELMVSDLKVELDNEKAKSSADGFLLNHQKTSFTFEIDNFSEKKYVIASPIFISGQCQWFVKVYTNGYFNKDHVSVYLHVGNPQSLRPGWKRRVNYSFILFNESGKELKRTPESCDLFCTEVSAWGYPKLLPLSKLKEEGFLENDKLIIKVEVKVVEVVHVGEVTGKEMVDFKGFHVLYTQVSMKRKKEDAGWSRVQQSKEAVKNFEVSLKGKKRDDADGSRLQQLEERLKNLELMELDCLKSKLEEVSLEKNKADADSSRLQQLEERLKNLELMELDCLKSKLEEVSLENKKANADWSRVQQLEERERVKNLELMELDCLKSKLEEVSLERKNSDDADRSLVQQLEECFKNLELMVLDLKVELDKKKDKSCDDGFLLVDEFA